MEVGRDLTEQTNRSGKGLPIITHSQMVGDDPKGVRVRLDNVFLVDASKTFVSEFALPVQRAG
jgi:hypothetical protein